MQTEGLTAAVVLALLVVGCAPAAPPREPESDAQDWDRVVLRDGSVVEGAITSFSEDGDVELRLPSGERVRFTRGELRQVIRASSAKAARPRAQARRDDDYDDDADTSRDEERSDTRVTASGASARWEKRTLVKEPPSSAAAFTIDGSFLYGTNRGDGPKLNIYGGGGSIGAKILASGNRLPGAAGGSWFGFALDPRANFQGAAIVQEIPTQQPQYSNGRLVGFRQGPPQTVSTGFTTGGFSTSAGFAFLNFQKMDSASLAQWGFGFQLGYSAGVQFTKVYPEAGEAPIETKFQHGPGFTLLVPRYNPGTSRVQAGYLSVFFLPTGDFLFTTIAAGLAL